MRPNGLAWPRRRGMPSVPQRLSRPPPVPAGAPRPPPRRLRRRTHRAWVHRRLPLRRSGGHRRRCRPLPQWRGHLRLPRLGRGRHKSPPLQGGPPSALGMGHQVRGHNPTHGRGTNQACQIPDPTRPMDEPIERPLGIPGFSSGIVLSPMEKNSSDILIGGAAAAGFVGWWLLFVVGPRGLVGPLAQLGGSPVGQPGSAGGPAGRRGPAAVGCLRLVWPVAAVQPIDFTILILFNHLALLRALTKHATLSASYTFSGQPDFRMRLCLPVLVALLRTFNLPHAFYTTVELSGP